MAFASVNPATGEVVAEFEGHTPEQIEAAVALSARAFRAWRETPFKDRGELMTRAAQILEDEVDEVGAMLTREMGKTHAQAKGEVLKCAKTMRYYAEHAESMLAEEIIASPASRSGVRYEPLGPVLAVMPWNFALWQAVRFAAPAIMAGNVGILKHASNVPRSAKFLEDLFRRAGFPEGVFTTLFLGHQAAADLIADDRVAAVTLTGSEAAGKSVAAQAGAALKKCVLELGGSDAFIVASSADMATTIPMAVTARIQNNGQSCIASKRFIVVRERAEEFIEGFTTAMGAVVVGDPMDPATAMGPLVSAAQREELDAQVRASVAMGAVVRTGGRVLDGPGYYYAPTVLTDVPSDSRAGCEELFGPVAVVEVVEDLDEAIRVANSTPWGLGGSIWATDPSEIERAIAGVEAGMVFANAIVASTPELPFGGIKRSGYGRELSVLGIREFTNAKTFYIA
ncbi:MAG TPA: NAD-dependent succinate-semialdehyde dehydrogenase [Acidimicrobiales bacterium]|nr:MAG: NADP-dependent succinic semialdehyde dehydrogenase [Actinobacteria bacterium 21-73-9]HQU26027.1 NAD-dependent succinate-semialdehyde dehydrogenase [Acidimicrobiales bacterium]